MTITGIVFVLAMLALFVVVLFGGGQGRKWR